MKQETGARMRVKQGPRKGQDVRSCRRLGITQWLVQRHRPSRGGQT